MVWVATATLTVDCAIVVDVSEVEASAEVAEVVVELEVVNEMVDMESVVVVVSGTGVVVGSSGLPLVVVGRTMVTELEACLGAMRLKAR
jgi:hypothetical protein